MITRSPVTVVMFLACTLMLHLSQLQDAFFVADRVSKYSLGKNIIANLLRLPIVMVVFFTNEWSLILSAVLSFLIGAYIAGRRYRRKERPGYHFRLEFSRQVWKPILGFSFGNYVMNTVVSLP